ncbi:metal-dependent phosphohydrolase [Aquibium sp. ELW1220]|jgi:(p)ppGpp synthase/HD superfamily hydrolase|uniref:metal-dependent phosphohydrolase n=1 Tax=Aquibium sp. ELW1220 TaxID=2976766 RepID=UPI0025AEF579|nr:metal-dependent phosphohydrolase [Aquibium sp. ELW1220]MDN2578515.1 metal-dependent phosphohydrolase [Aquibium sp. ELW1220]
MSDPTTARMLERAIGIAASAHEGQTDKTGLPMLDHCRRVAADVAGTQAKTVAFLHDVVEKNADWTVARLVAEGFPQPIVRAVDAMTRREGEDYMAFARRAASDPLARDVKRADLEDNLRQARDAALDGTRFADALDMLVREGLLDTR